MLCELKQLLSETDVPEWRWTDLRWINANLAPDEPKYMKIIYIIRRMRNEPTS